MTNHHACKRRSSFRLPNECQPMKKRSSDDSEPLGEQQRAVNISLNRSVHSPISTHDLLVNDSQAISPSYYFDRNEIKKFIDGECVPMLIQREWFNEHDSNYLRPEVYKDNDVRFQLKRKLDLVKEVVLNRVRSALNKEDVIEILKYLLEETEKVKNFLMQKVKIRLQDLVQNGEIQLGRGFNQHRYVKRHNSLHLLSYVHRLEKLVECVSQLERVYLEFVATGQTIFTRICTLHLRYH